MSDKELTVEESRGSTMTESTTDVTLLDAAAIAEIEALSAKVPDGPWFTAHDDADDVPDHRRSGLALVETGRSDDWWIARLCEWPTANFIGFFDFFLAVGMIGG